jgi:hypothetical protein
VRPFHRRIIYSSQNYFRALSDMISAYRGAKSRPSLESKPLSHTGDNSEPPASVLPSSTELFYFYGQNLEQCAKLSNKGPLFDLSTLHKKWLRIYAGESDRSERCMHIAECSMLANQRTSWLQVSNGSCMILVSIVQLKSIYLPRIVYLGLIVNVDLLMAV